MLKEYTRLENHVIPCIIKKGNKYICQRCSNKSPKLFFKDFFGVYCLKCLKFGKSSINTKIERKSDYLKEDVEYCLNKDIYLSNIQKVASKRCLDAFKSRENLIIFAVCGSGKTEIVYDVILQALNNKNIICFATPRKDVVCELVPRFKRDFNHIKIVSLYAGSPDIGEIGNLYVTTTHQLINFYQYFDLIILDEVDAFPYYNNKMLESFIMKSKKVEAPIIYLTATPTKRLKYLMKTKKLPYVVIPARFHQYSIPVPSVKLTNNTIKSIEKGLLPKVIEKWLVKKKFENKSVFIFVPTVEQGMKLEKIMKGNFDCKFVYSESKERKEIISLFRGGKLQYIITTTILERGVTVKDVDVCIINCHNRIFDERAIVQIAGRVGRSKDYPIGDIKLFTDVNTLAIKHAIVHIKRMNRLAKKENLLRS